MRAPPNSLGTVLLAGFVAAVIAVLGGPGGAWLALRVERRRIDALEDDLETTRVRLSRREGAAGRAVALERKSREEADIERIVAQAEEGEGHAPRGRKRNGSPTPQAAFIPDWARGIVG